MVATVVRYTGPFVRYSCTSSRSVASPPAIAGYTTRRTFSSGAASEASAIENRMFSLSVTFLKALISRADQRLQEGDRQGEHPVLDRRGLARGTGGEGAPGGVAIAGGEATLRELVHEYRTKGPVYRTTVATTLRASYTNHYRRGLIRLLEVLQFRSSNATHRPVIGALELVSRYAAAGNLSYYTAGEHVPAHPGLRGDWEPLVHKVDKRGRRRTVRMAYEVCTFRELRERLRCKEIWVVGAERWRNPDEDLPADFEERRHEHYRELSKPLDAAAFVDPLREEMHAELAALYDALPAADWLQVADRPAGAIKLAPIEAAPEPRNLRRLKAEVGRRRGMVPLIDMPKEAVLRTGCLKRGHLGRRPRHDQPGEPGRAVDAGDLRLRH